MPRAIPTTATIATTVMTATTAALALVICTSALAADPQIRLLECANVDDNILRLACYDRIAGKNLDTAEGKAQAPKAIVAAPAAATAAPLPAPLKQPPPSRLARHWETDVTEKHGVFAFRSHEDNYLLFANYNQHPNNAPYLPFRALSPNQADLQKTELAFQLGFKMKLIEDISAQHADLWFGYTQRSFWQAYNAGASRPFRDTNYQPELIAVIPAKFNVLGMQTQFVNLGLVHQSNGQVSTLSRSWNRLYVQAGADIGDHVNVVARVWKRLQPNSGNDDNPDILDYMGHGDVTATYISDGGQRLSLLARHNFATGRGATQLGWVVPIKGDLKAYAQVFSGYGQSLIDYNAYQRSVGLGVMVDY